MIPISAETIVGLALIAVIFYVISALGAGVAAAFSAMAALVMSPAFGPLLMLCGGVAVFAMISLARAGSFNHLLTREKKPAFWTAWFSTSGASAAPKRAVDPAVIAATLKSRIFGQDHVADAIADQIAIRFAKSRRKQPIGVFLFVGPPAVGKTECASAIASALGGEMFEVEGAAYGQSHTASTLFGMPKGYVGSEQPGKLTAFIKRNRNGCVVVLDEFEKMHPDVRSKFLSSWSNGSMTELSTDERISTASVLFILTSNACQREVLELAQQFKDDHGGLSNACKAALQDAVAPEVLSRVDRVFVFQALEGLDQCKVVAACIQKEIESFDVRLAEIDPSILFGIIEQARTSRVDTREIARMIEGQISKQVIALKNRGARSVRLVAGANNTVSVEGA